MGSVDDTGPELRRKKMQTAKNIPGKEVLINVMERKFEPQFWVGDLPEDISTSDRKIRILEGFVGYQDNKLQDVMRVIARLIEHLEYFGD